MQCLMSMLICKQWSKNVETTLWCHDKCGNIVLACGGVVYNNFGQFTYLVRLHSPILFCLTNFLYKDLSWNVFIWFFSHVGFSKWWALNSHLTHFLDELLVMKLSLKFYYKIALTYFHINFPTHAIVQLPQPLERASCNIVEIDWFIAFNLESCFKFSTYVCTPMSSCVSGIS